jgi:hypothetical protein
VDTNLAEKLFEQQLISQSELDNLRKQQNQPISLYWDLTSLLYLGIVLLTTGLGIIVYKNIDSIGHAVIIAAIAIVCIACFAYCFNKAAWFSTTKVKSPSFLFDYILLLGCLLLLTLIGYLQFEYNLFGNHWGMATFIPMVILFFAAYYFDHIGVLSLAITNLAAWAGLTVAPLHFFRDNDFRSERLIYTGLLLGFSLVAIAIVSGRRNIKAHFAFTFKNFGVHILFISLLAAMFHFDNVYLLWLTLLAGVSTFFIRDALKEHSFYIFVITVMYAYIAVSYAVIDLLIKIGGDIGTLYLGLIYFIASGIALIKVLIYFNKIIRKNASL